MVLSLLIYARSLRFAAPTALLLTVAPHYLATWLTWRFVSLIFPRRTFEIVDEFFYGAYQSYVTFFFEVYNGTKVIFYGDHLPTDKKESTLYISNHQSAVDWVVSDMIAIRQGSLGSLRYVFKDGLRYLPMYGFYFAQHGGIYVKRNDEKNENKIRRRLQRFIATKTPLWLVIFPEGTRYNVNKPEVIERSQKFAEENDYPVMEHVLVPRSKATQLSLEEIGSYIDAIYDVTIAYRDPRKDLLPREEGPNLTEFLADGNQEVHVHISCIRGDEIPKTSTEIKTWLLECFQRKDRLLSEFYDKEKGGMFPGQRYTLPVPFRRTFLPTLVFGTTVVLTLASSRGRSLYWKWSLGSGLATVLYMALCYDRLQT